MSEDQARLRAQALAALARREHSRLELQRKLKARGHAAGEVAEVLDDLAAKRLQSDARHAEAYTRSRAERGYGPLWIARELEQRGTSAELIGQALRAAEHDWRVIAVAADRKKFGGMPPADPKTLAKRRRFLASRGFTGDQIKAVLSGCEND